MVGFICRNMVSIKDSIFSENDLLCIHQLSHYLTPFSNDFKELVDQQPKEEDINSLHKLQLQKRGYQLSSEKRLGEGGFGVVYQVHPVNDSSKQFACKVVVLRKEKMSSRDYLCLLKSFNNEVQIMQDCSHENIVSLRQYFLDNHEDKGPIHGYIIMDFAHKGSLANKLKISGPFDEPTARDMFCQMANALEHLHCQGIAHLDLTLANVLLTSDGDREQLKLTDFGLSFKAFSEQSGLILLSKPVGTLFYMSPELIECFILYYTGEKAAIRPYNCFSADLWALGVCLYMILCKVNPFKSSPLEPSAISMFHSLQSYDFETATIQTAIEGEEMQSEPKESLMKSASKEMRIHLARSIREKQTASEQDQWQVPDAIKQSISEPCLHMITGLLTSDPQARFDIAQVQSHSWLT